MSKGVIYVLTNPSFPEYVKIGYATKLETRLKQLNQSECLPFAFRAYCVYETEDKLTDKNVHELIDKLNPGLRAIETFDGKPRVREFYNMSAEDAYQILHNIAKISGTMDRLKKLAPEGHELIDLEIADDFADKVTYTEADHLDNKGSTFTISLYGKLKDKLLDLEDVVIEPKKLYIAFKYVTNICDIVVQKSKLRVFINLKNGELDDSSGLLVEADKGHWGNGDYYFDLTDETFIDYLLILVKKAYDKQKE